MSKATHGKARLGFEALEGRMLLTGNVTSAIIPAGAAIAGNDFVAAPVSAVSLQTLKFNGTVVYNTFEGGFYGIVADDGTSYDPIGLPSAFAKDGMRVHVVAQPCPGMASIHMWGEIVKVTAISSLASPTVGLTPNSAASAATGASNGRMLETNVTLSAQPRTQTVPATTTANSAASSEQLGWTFSWTNEFRVLSGPLSLNELMMLMDRTERE